MTSLQAKARHVLSAGQTRNHECHWPGYAEQVPPAMFMCSKHWLALPKRLRDRIWQVYELGQEETMTPSAEYLQAARDAERWITEHGKGAAGA